MTRNMEEIILDELFKLSGKVDKIQEEMKNFATKDDLKNFATKDDLKNFATKDDLKNFATKDDLNDLEERMTQNMNDLEERMTQNMNDLEERMTKNMNEIKEGLMNKINREAHDAAQIFNDVVGYEGNKRYEMEERLNQKIDSKFESLPCQIKLNTVNSN